MLKKRIASTGPSSLTSASTPFFIVADKRQDIVDKKICQDIVDCVV